DRHSERAGGPPRGRTDRPRRIARRRHQVPRGVRVSRGDGPRQGPSSPRGARLAARRPRVSTDRRVPVCRPRVRRPLVHAAAGSARRVRVVDPGPRHGRRQREVVQGHRDCRGPRLSLFLVRPRPRDVLAGRPVSTVDGGRLHLRLGTPRSDLGGRRCEGPRLDEARESREEGEVKMAATVQSKGSGGGAPPSYVKTPASWFIVSVPQGILGLELALLDLAEAHADAPMPGYTHLQRAQPVTVGHHLLAHVWPLIRDDLRLADGFGRANVSPLGAGALAGSTLPIDPAISARILGFAGPFENSIDAVGDRDHFVEFVFDLSLLAVHLSSI